MNQYSNAAAFLASALGILSLASCEKVPNENGSSTKAESQRQKSFRLPDWFGLYALNNGILAEIKITNHPGDVTILRPHSDFLLFDKHVALGGPSSFQVHYGSSDEAGIKVFSRSSKTVDRVPIQLRARPIEGKPEMMQFAPVVPLETGIYYTTGAVITQFVVLSEEDEARFHELRRREAAAQSNLHTIGTVLKLFANDNKEKYPPDLESLVPNDYMNFSLRSPMDTRTDDSKSIIYISGEI